MCYWSVRVCEWNHESLIWFILNYLFNNKHSAFLGLSLLEYEEKIVNEHLKPILFMMRRSNVRWVISGNCVNYSQRHAEIIADIWMRLTDFGCTCVQICKERLLKCFKCVQKEIRKLVQAALNEFWMENNDIQLFGRQKHVSYVLNTSVFSLSTILTETPPLRHRQ